MKNRPVFTLYPKGNRPVFQLSPLGAGVKKLKNLIGFKSVKVELDND
jgi:hypothetical protein